MGSTQTQQAENASRQSGRVPAAKDRATRFLRRVDVYLPSLRNAKARLTFLDRQIEGWEHRYARFLATEGETEPAVDPADPPQAADFLLTIQGLASRRSAVASRTGERRMMHTSQERLDQAILSILVAADQRCPAIIGQAHVLYHAHAGTLRADTEKALTQLKSEAEQLLAAIAQAENAMRTSLAQGLNSPR